MSTTERQEVEALAALAEALDDAFETTTWEGAGATVAKAVTAALTSQGWHVARGVRMPGSLDPTEMLALEWLARLVEEIGWGADATEGESYYRIACDLLGHQPRKLAIREPSNDTENVERIRAALGAPSSAPEGPWCMRPDEHGDTRRGWCFTEGPPYEDGDGMGRYLWLDRDDFTETEALAVRDALNLVAARVHREEAPRE